MNKNIKKNKQYYMWIILAVIGVAFIVFLQYLYNGHYFLSKGVWSDLLRVNLPTYYQMYDSFSTEGYMWSWNMGIGTSMFSHADVYFDPFTYILFIFGREYIPNMMIIMYLVKLVCEGITFYTYIDYFKIDKRAGVISAVLYAFCGYSLVMGNNFVLGTILVYAPLVLLGIERWINEGKIKLLVVSLFLTCIYSYYFFFAMGLFSAVYLVFRLCQKGKRWLKYLMLLAGVGIIVIMLSLFSVLPQIRIVLASSRVSGSEDIPTGLKLFIPQVRVLITSIVRVLGLDILGNSQSGTYIGEAFWGARDYYQLSTYVSSLFIILLVQYWHFEKKKRKEIVIVTVMLGGATIIPFFSYVFNACATTNTRWMFIVALIECIMIGFAISNIIKNGGLNVKALFIGIISSFIIVVLALIFITGNVNEFFRNMHIYRKYFFLFLVLYTIMFIIYVLQNLKGQLSKYVIYMLVGLLIVMEEGVNYYEWYGVEGISCQYSEMDQSSYMDSSSELISDIMEEDSSWYRINKTFDSVYDNNGIPSENDAMVQGYYGLKCYNSLNNANYIEFLQSMGIYVCIPWYSQYYKDNGIQPKDVVGSQLNYIDGVYDRYNLLSFLGVKYYITKDAEKELPECFHLNSTQSGILVYENDNAFPLAFVNSKTISKSQFERLSENEKDYALLQYTVVDDDIADIEVQIDELEIEKKIKEKQDAFELKSFEQDKVVFDIMVTQGGYLSFSIPYDKDWNVYIDGRKVDSQKINISLLGAKISEGGHEVKIVYRNNSFIIGIVVSFISFISLILMKKTFTKIFTPSLDNKKNKS